MSNAFTKNEIINELHWACIHYRPPYLGCVALFAYNIMKGVLHVRKIDTVDTIKSRKS